MNPKGNGQSLKPWPKGTSGNPGGRPKAAPIFRKRCREIVDEKVVDAWEKEVDERGTYWVRCSELLAAYGYGPPKLVAGAPEEADAKPIERLTVEQLEAIASLKLSSEQPPVDAVPDPDSDTEH